MANYRIGTGDPTIKPDSGAGVWNSQPKTLKMSLMAAEIVQHVPHATVLIGSDAAKNMFHYFKNQGTDLVIDLEGMLEDVPSAQDVFNKELEAAKRFVESLPVGTHPIASESVTHGYNQKAESANWYFANGGYSAWGKGVADVARISGVPSSQLEFEFHFFDHYNWDNGKKVSLFGITITDTFMGDFHRQGLAREFNCVASLTSKHNWGAPRPAPAPAPAVQPRTPPPPPG